MLCAALDQAMTFLAVVNRLCGGSVQRQFAADPITARAPTARWDVAHGKLSVLVGPSGCGTTREPSEQPYHSAPDGLALAERSCSQGDLQHDATPAGRA